MKKNAVWTPSETMINRELKALGRGQDAYWTAKKRAEDEGRPFDNNHVPTLVVDDESGQKHLPEGAISLDAAETFPESNKGMLLPRCREFIAFPPLGQTKMLEAYGKLTKTIVEDIAVKADNIQGEGEVRIQRRDIMKKAEKQLSQIHAVMGSMCDPLISPRIHEQSHPIRLSFYLHVSPSVKSVHLLGSWDNYAGQLPLSKNNTSSNSGLWKGIFGFSRSTIEDGRQYWYYFIIDGYRVAHNPTHESTIEPTTGRTVNIINIPKASSFSNSTEGELPTTMTVAARKMTEDAVKDNDGDTNADEPRYCYCNDVSCGSMISCDAEDCEREWFHMECIGLEVAPKPHGKHRSQNFKMTGYCKLTRSVEKWYCEDCRERLETTDPETTAPKASRAGDVAHDLGLGVSDLKRVTRSAGYRELPAIHMPSPRSKVPLDTYSLMNIPKRVKIKTRIRPCETCRLVYGPATFCRKLDSPSSRITRGAG
jgi:hypothetical protein